MLLRTKFYSNRIGLFLRAIARMAATPKRVAAISLMGDIFVSHHFRKQRLLPARRLFAFPNKALHQSSLKGELAAEYVCCMTTSQEVVAYAP